MQPCGKCGNYNSDESIFCGHCANRLNNNCPDCGFKNLMQQKFCGSCGKQLLTDLDSGMETVRQSPIVPEPQRVSVSTQTMQPVTQSELLPEKPQALEAYPALDAYALASIEFANWKQLLVESTEPELLMTYQAQVLDDLVRKISDAGGEINASKNNILFVSFRHETSPESSIGRGIETALMLLKEKYQLKQTVLSLRIGLDVEFARSRNPLTSTLERSVGQPNSLIVSERVFQLFSSRYPMEPVGPVAMGNRSMTFYKVSAPLPQPQEVLGQPTVVQSAPPASVVPPVAPAPVPTAAPSPLEPPVQEVVAPATVPSPPVMAPPAPPVESEQTASEKGFAFPAPPLPVYEPPLLGSFKAPRQDNLTYEMAVEALTSEFSAFLAQGLSGGKGKVLALCAANGLGKSSILHMARAKADPENQRGIWMGGTNYRALQRNGVPLFFWLELVQNLLSLVFEGQPGGNVRDEIGKFLGFVFDGEPPTEVVSFLSDFLLVNPPQPFGAETRTNLERIEHFFLGFFRTLATKRPLILVVEDLEYADPATLDLLTRLLEKDLLNSPVYLVLTQTKDFYTATRLADVFQKVTYKELVVANLDQAAAVKFLDDGPLGGQLHTFPTQLVDSLLRHAKGLPLYLEEALRLMHLKEALVVEPSSGKFTLSPNFDPADWQFSEHLAEVVFARFQFLDEPSLYLLQLSSVLGEKFAVNMLFALAQMDEEPFNQALTTLFNHGYLIPDAVNTGRFRHGLLWEIVYETIEDDLKVQIHQLISEALEGDFNQGVTVHPALIAYHSQNGNLPNRAVNYWNLAGIYCGQIGSLTGFNLCLFQALHLMEQQEDVPLSAQELALRMMESAAAFNLDGDPALAAGMLEWVFHYRKHEGEPLKLIEPLGFLASAYENMGDYPKALVTLEKSLEFIEPSVYPLEAAALQINKMEYLYTLGRLQQARTLMEESIEPIARMHAGESPEFTDAFLQARLLKAQIMLAQCDSSLPDEIEVSLKQATERGLEGLQIAFRLLRGQVHLRNGLYETCNREADGLLSAIEAMPDSDWFLAQWGLLAILYHCELVDWASASQLVLTVMSKAEVARDYHTCVVAQIYAGYIAGQMGKVKEARQLIEQGIAQSSEHRFASAALLGWRCLAEFELSLGNLDVASEIAEKALEIANKPDIQNRYEQIQLTFILARALLAKEQAKEAGKLLEPLWPQVVQSHWQPLIASCAFEIGQLYKGLAQDVPADLSRKYLTRSVEFFLKAKGIWLELRNLGLVKKVDQVIPKL